MWLEKFKVFPYSWKKMKRSFLSSSNCIMAGATVKGPGPSPSSDCFEHQVRSSSYHTLTEWLSTVEFWAAFNFLCHICFSCILRVVKQTYQRPEELTFLFIKYYWYQCCLSYFFFLHMAPWDFTWVWGLCRVKEASRNPWELCLRAWGWANFPLSPVWGTHDIFYI